MRVENTFNPTYTTTQFTSSTSATLTGLIANTNYIVYVSATSCGVHDDYGLEQQRPFSTTAIIIENIVYLGECPNYAPITIPPSGVVLVDLDPNTGMPINQFRQYKITKGYPNGQPSTISSVEFGAWNYLNGQGYDAYFQQKSINDLIRNPDPNYTGPANSIGYKQTNASLDFVTIKAIASSAGAQPQLRFEFIMDNQAPPQLFVCGGRTSGGKGGGSSSEEFEHATPTKLTATPNPFTDQTTLHYTVGKDSPVTLSLYNSTGTLVKTVLNKVWTEAGNQETLVEMSDLPNGLYFVTLETNEGRQVSTLVKTN